MCIGLDVFPLDMKAWYKFHEASFQPCLFGGIVEDHVSGDPDFLCEVIQSLSNMSFGSEQVNQYKFVFVNSCPHICLEI